MYTLNNQFFYQPITSEDYSVFYNIKFSMDNPDRTIKQCFSVIYNDGLFLEAVYLIIKSRDDFIKDGCYIYYSENECNTVVFENGFNDPEWITSVSEKECFEYFKNACIRFLELHPENKYKEFLYEILENWKLSNEKSEG